MTDESMKKKNIATKKKLINSIAQDKNIHPNDARQVIQAFLEKITESLKKVSAYNLETLASLKSSQENKKLAEIQKKLMWILLFLLA